MKRKLIVLFAAAILIFAGTWKGKVYREEGVEVVENEAPLLKPEDVRLVEELALGAEEKPEELVFFSISLVTVDEDFNIYVVDARKGRISKFSEKGELLWSVGRRGQGPGEISSPNSIAVVDGKLLLVDSKVRLLSFDAEKGTFLGERKLVVTPFRPILLPDGRIMEASPVRGKAGFRLVLRDGQGRELRKVDEYFYGKNFPSGAFIFLFWGFACSGNWFLAVLPDRYEIREYDLEGNLKRRILRKDFQPRKPEVKVTKTGKYISIRSYFPDAIGPAMKWRGGIVVSRRKTDKGILHFLDFFDSRGRFLTSVKAEEPVLLTTDSRGRLYFLRVDPYPQVVRVRVEVRGN